MHIEISLTMNIPIEYRRVKVLKSSGIVDANVGGSAA